MEGGIRLKISYQIVHVALGLGELHLVHALPGVPVEERLAPEHRGELLRDPLKQLLEQNNKQCQHELLIFKIS